MSFESINFSPVGDNARKGNALQKFSYITADVTGVVVTPGYFDELIGDIKRGDWVEITENIGGTSDQAIRAFLGDGQSPSALTAAIVTAGTGYAAGAVVSVNLDGTIFQEVLVQVLNVSSGVPQAVRIFDPGLWDPTDEPTDFTGIATTDLTGSGDDALTITLTPALAAGLFGTVTLNNLVRFMAA